MNENELVLVVKELVRRAGEAETSDDALKLSQAALNVANAIAKMAS